MNKNVWLPVMIVIILIVFASGCTSKKETNSSSSSAPSATNGENNGEKQVSLNLLSLTLNYLPSEIEAFEKKYPNIKINYQSYEDQQYKKQLDITMSAGEIPDVYVPHAGENFWKYAGNGYHLDITDIAKEKGWNDAIYESYRNMGTDASGKEYGLVWGSIAPWMSIYYNKDLFEKYKIQIPKTVDDLIKVSEQFKAQGLPAVAWGDSDGWPGPIFLGDYYLQLASPDDANKLRSGETKWAESKELREAMDTLIKLDKSKVFVDGYLTQNQDSAIFAFNNGKVPMLYNGSWWQGNVDKVIVNAGVFSLPLINDQAKINGVQYWPDLMLAISSKLSDDKKDAAIKFVDYLLGTDSTIIMGNLQKANVTNMEANKSIQMPELFKDPSLTAQLDLPKMEYWTNYFPVPVYDALAKGIQQILVGDSTYDKVMSNIDEIYEKYRNENPGYLKDLKVHPY